MQGRAGAGQGELSEGEAAEAAAVLQLLAESSAQLQDREALRYVAATAALLQVPTHALYAFTHIHLISEGLH